MIKPFNHRSPVIHVVETLGIAATIGVAIRMTFLGSGWFAWLMFAIVVAIYAFIRCCTTVHWHKEAERYEGIELHFKKALSPTAYIMFIGGIVFQIVPSSILLIVMAFMLAVIAHVNVILLYLHRRDNQELPINYFTGNKGPRS